MEIIKLNHRHEGLINWLIEHPDKTLTECASVMGYTLPWLSQLMASDMFQASYKQLCRERNEIAVHSVGERLNRLASSALVKAQELLDAPVVSEGFIKSILPTALDRTGYGTKDDGKKDEGGGDKHEHLHITVESMEKAIAIRRAMQGGS